MLRPDPIYFELAEAICYSFLLSDKSPTTNVGTDIGKTVKYLVARVKFAMFVTLDGLVGKKSFSS